jgi:hypothetical protein
MRTLFFQVFVFLRTRFLSCEKLELKGQLEARERVLGGAKKKNSYKN